MSWVPIDHAFRDRVIVAGRRWKGRWVLYLVRWDDEHDRWLTHPAKMHVEPTHWIYVGEGP